MENLNVIEKANKVLGFRLQISNACKKQNVKMPSDEKIAEYIEQGYGFDVKDFMADYTSCEGIFRCEFKYSPLEQKTLDATLKLNDVYLVGLWNLFIEESALYGADSYIYNTEDYADMKFLRERMDDEQWNDVVHKYLYENTFFIQWIDGNVLAKKHIKGIITAYWGEIFERIMLYPSIYNTDIEDNLTYFYDIFFPIIANEVGYKIDVMRGTIEKIKK